MIANVVPPGALHGAKSPTDLKVYVVFAVGLTVACPVASVVIGELPLYHCHEALVPKLPPV